MLGGTVAWELIEVAAKPEWRERAFRSPTSDTPENAIADVAFAMAAWAVGYRLSDNSYPLKRAQSTRKNANG
jgi:hypothetical protein